MYKCEFSKENASIKFSLLNIVAILYKWGKIWWNVKSPVWITWAMLALLLTESLWVLVDRFHQPISRPTELLLATSLSHSDGAKARETWSLQFESSEQCQCWYWHNLYKCWLMEFHQPISRPTEFLLATSLSHSDGGKARETWSFQFETSEQCQCWYWHNLYKCWLMEFRRHNSGSCQLTEFLLAMFCSLTEFLLSSSSSESYPLLTWPKGGLSNTPAVELRWLRLLLLLPIGRPLWAPSVFIWDLRRSAMTELRLTSSALIVSFRKVSLRPSTGVPEQRQKLSICTPNKGMSSNSTFNGSLFHLHLINGFWNCVFYVKCSGRITMNLK
jgi:hypothetical protein